MDFIMFVIFYFYEVIYHIIMVLAIKDDIYIYLFIYMQFACFA